jgi:hypothetical protein
MKVGDLVKMAGRKKPIGLVVSIDRRHGADSNRHSRIATIITSFGRLVTCPLDSYYQIRVINESR